MTSVSLQLQDSSCQGWRHSVFPLKLSVACSGHAQVRGLLMDVSGVRFVQPVTGAGLSWPLGCVVKVLRNTQNRQRSYPRRRDALSRAIVESGCDHQLVVNTLLWTSWTHWT